MRTLPSNISASYLKSSASYRLFVELPDAGLFLGTEGATIDGVEFGDRINPAGTIVWDSPLFGGMGSISNVNISNIELDRDLSFSTFAEIEPYPQYSLNGAGHVSAFHASDYSLARGSLLGTVNPVAMVVGRKQEMPLPPTYNYTVWRPYFQFKPPADLVTCEGGSIHVDGLEANTISSFDCILVKGTWPVLGYVDMFRRFDGWASGMTAYTGQQCNKSFGTAHFSASGENAIRLNEYGRAVVEEAAAAGDFVRFALLSSSDYDGDSAPAGNEYLTFDASSARLRLRYNTSSMLNTAARIYLAVDPVPSSSADMLLLWTGVVSSYAISERSLDLELQQDNRRQNVILPRRTITLEEFPDCPETNVGKPWPMLFGDFTTAAADVKHKNGVGYFYGEAGSAGGEILYGYRRNMFPAIIAQQTAAAKQAILAGHDLKQHGNPLYLWNGSRNTYELFPVAMTHNTGETDGVLYDLSTVGFSSDFPDSAVIYPFSIVQTSRPSGHDTEGSPVWPERSYDDDPANWSLLVDEGDIIYYRFADPNGASIKVGTRIWMVMSLAFIEGSQIQVIFQYSDDDGYTWQDFTVNPTYRDYSADGQVAYGVHTDATLTFTISSLTQFRLKVYKTVPDGAVRIYNVCCVIGYGNDEVNEALTFGQGRPDDGAGTVTGEAAKLIENPAHVVESIARDDMGLDGDGIDTDAFDDAAELLDGWKFAFHLGDSRDSLALFDELGAQSKSTIVYDSQNRLKMLAFDPDRPFPHADSATPDVPGELDIFDEEDYSSGGEFTRHHIVPETFEVRPVNLNEIRNDFKLYYNNNYASGEYEGYLYIDHGDGDADDVSTNIDEANLDGGRLLDGAAGLKEMTARCYNNIRSTNTMVIECPAIRDEATATKLLQHEVERRTRELREASFETYMTAVAHEIGDPINIRHSRLTEDNLLGEAEMNAAKWEIKRYELDDDNWRVKIKALEM